MRRHPIVVRMTCACVALVGPAVVAAEERLPLAPTMVVARVEDRPITYADVDAELRAKLRERTLTGLALDQAAGAALQELIDRRLVEIFLDKQPVVGPKGAADAKGSAKPREPSYQDRWEAYLVKALTDRRLADYFAAHQREFDGTELRISHILLAGDALGDLATARRLSDEAAQLRIEIVAGKRSFADVARERSAGPSRKDGGDLGYIPRHGVMVESFAKAAFALQQDEISRPVVTPFGVHLIQCTDIRPGTKTWQDARADLLPAVTREVFLKAAGEGRKLAKVSYTPEWTAATSR